MKDYLRRTVAWILTFMMLFTCMPMNALAAIVDVSSAVQPFRIVKPSDDTQKKYATYIFRSGTGTDATVLAEQIVASEETLLAPASPEKKGYKFLNWYYLDEADNHVPQVVGEAVTVDKTETITLYP